MLLLIDGLNFLRTHMKDLGHIVGQVGIWLGENFPGIIRGAAGLAVDAMKDLVGAIVDVLNPVNWLHALDDFKKGVHQAVNDEQWRLDHKYGLTPAQKRSMSMLSPLSVLPGPQQPGPTVNQLHITVKANSRAEGTAAGGGLLSIMRQQGFIVNSPTGPGLGGMVPAAASR